MVFVLTCERFSAQAPSLSLTIPRVFQLPTLSATVQVLDFYHLVLVAFARDEQVELAEFLDTLSPKLKELCLWRLDPGNRSKRPPWSAATYRKRNERLRKAIRAYVNVRRRARQRRRPRRGPGTEAG